MTTDDTLGAPGVRQPTAAPEAAPVRDGLPQPQRLRAMVVMVLGISVAVLDGTIVNLALPGIARELDASASHAIWVINAYQIATLVLLLPLASLGDLIGYRRVYLWGMALFTVSSLGATLADSLGTLIAARMLQGMGAAGIMSVNAALVRLIYPSDRLGRGVAINSMVVAIASVAGPSVAAGIVRRRFRLVPVAQQPHHRDLAAAPPQRRGGEVT
ncbi:MAG: MFS transporter, partial [Variovorax sp.]